MVCQGAWSFEDFLRFFIQRRTFFLCWQNLGFLNQGVEFLVAPIVAPVGFSLRRPQPSKNREKFRGFTVDHCPNPANGTIAVFSLWKRSRDSPPFVGNDLDVDTDWRIFLHQLGHIGGALGL